SRAVLLKDLDRCRRGPARGDHGVDHDVERVARSFRYPLVVRDRALGAFVAIHAHVPDAGRGHEIEDALQHADTGAQDRHHDQLLVYLVALGGRERRLDADLPDLDRLQRLVADEPGDLARQRPELLVAGPAIPDQRQLVADTGVGDLFVHGLVAPAAVRRSPGR